MIQENRHPIKGLVWPRLIRGTLLKRYKRFLADIRLKNGHVVTAHCPNSGSMLGCSEPGRPVFLSKHNHPKRRLKYTWEMIEMPRSMVGINTLIPNRLVKQAILQNQIQEFSGYDNLRSEVVYGQRSRVDLLLEKQGQRCFVEIKNCTLMEGRTALFPDAVTSRGLRHLKELQREVRSGHRAVMFYLIQRMDAKIFKPAHHIDPDYGEALEQAAGNGVEIMVYDVQIDLQGICLRDRVPFEI
ncbi:MAG: DNA/RNA nuclease SfsA [Deltaproteobacteria bacterium]|nr:DNA/RNA nuclease SfsA [Deltaproteobacteria bacterium]